ncbi:sugar porter family MFS transporter [Luteimonas aquatica]|uniref:sugar porter family MFS transporter n=1 Tax=Luteimonas aquatica TaxID=450364 RepID=UPI001F5906C0|nr:sugar porter family MFS transporter [Luteimonas aquatica]
MNAVASASPARASNARVIAIASVAALGGFLFGFDTAVINGAVDAIRGDFRLDAALIGFAVSCALLGSALGAWYAGPIADRWGRVRTMQVAAVALTVSALGSGLVVGVWDLVFWRLVGGMGVGIASVIAPAYIAEISPARVRGRLGSLQQLAIVLGIFVALASDALLAHLAGGAAQPLWLGLNAWRWMFLVAALPALVYGLLVLRVPESPRYLVAKGEKTLAASVLRQVLNLDDGEALRHKIEEIDASLRAEHRPRLRDLRKAGGGLLPVVWIGILLSVFQQFVGINVIFYYSSTLWHSVGFSEADAFKITVATSVVNVLVTLVAIALVDRIGRKPLLVVGSAGMAIALAVMAWCFSRASGGGADIQLPEPWGPVALVAANLYVIFFGVSWGPVVWVLLGEMFPNRIRAIALAVAAAAQWLANFAITATFPGLAEIGLSFAYGLYAAFALLSFVFVLAMVRETKGMELEEMRG